MFPKNGYPEMDGLLKMDDLGVPLFLEAPIQYKIITQPATRLFCGIKYLKFAT